jgi:hypothetical protein
VLPEANEDQPALADIISAGRKAGEVEQSKLKPPKEKQSRWTAGGVDDLTGQ